MSIMRLDAVRRLASKAQASGATRLSLTLWEWDISGRCRDPQTRHMHGRVDTVNTKYVIIGKGANPNSIGVIMHVKCRKCDLCRDERRRLWAARAKTETQQAVRTWFGTLTLSPEAHMRVLSNARARLSKGGTDFDALPIGEQFLERHREIGPELAKYLKRIRKNSGASLRILQVAEAHKSGLPHYHLLVHEQDPALPIRKHVLKEAWALGFSAWKLTEPERAGYLCKYLSKNSVARVRASLNYGEQKNVLTT